MGRDGPMDCLVILMGEILRVFILRGEGSMKTKSFKDTAVREEPTGGHSR